MRRLFEVLAISFFVILYVTTTIVILLRFKDHPDKKATLAPCRAADFQNALTPDSNCTVISAEEVQKGGSYGQGQEHDLAYPVNPQKLPHLCAVYANVSSSPQSSYTFGLFLPVERWNGRFLAVGNGGYAGGIDWQSMANGAAGYGFASMSTDTGHTSSAMDGSWSYNAPERVIDWSYRAVHGSTVLAKQIVEHFYGKSAHHNYFSGCSMGGRQGLKAAQMYPEDYDGILAGSPAWWMQRLPFWTVKLGVYNLPNDSTHHIPPSLFPVILNETIRQCDSVDGVNDTIVVDPRRCNFNTKALLCNDTLTASSGKCLTPPQVETLDHLYADYVDASGQLIFPALVPGSEEDSAMVVGGTNNTPSPLGNDYIKYMLGNIDFTWQQYNDELVTQFESKNPANASADNFDMSAFRNRGGKMITTHGWADGLISTGSSIVLYNRVNKTMSSVAIDDWYRLFLQPGMRHCGGTPDSMKSPWYVGGPNQARLIGNDTYGTPGFDDPKYDLHLAIIDWVEKAKAPDKITATYWRNDTPSLGVIRQRPICPYPQEPTFTGTNYRGETNNVQFWDCKPPNGTFTQKWE